MTNLAARRQAYTPGKMAHRAVRIFTGDGVAAFYRRVA